jgi:hypothetical protein
MLLRCESLEPPMSQLGEYTPLPDAALVLDVSGIALEPLAQIGEPRRIGDEFGQVVGDVVLEDRLQSERRRHVVARRVRSASDSR